MISQHLTTHDLITTDQQVVEGTRWQTSKKRELMGIMEQDIEDKIKTLKKLIKNKKQKELPIFLSELIKNDDVFSLITSSLGYSEKNLRNLNRKEVLSEIKRNIHVDDIHQRGFFNTLRSRCAFTMGNALGGKMNNIIGQKGNELFCRIVEGILKSRDIDYEVTKKNGNTQIIETEYTAILFNKKPKFIGKNIDFIVLVKNQFGDYDIEDPESYVSAGELKSGIDPAGADEHWKTATTALKRIHKSFREQEKDLPNLYFIGGAISKHMAEEIIEAIDKGFLKGAANLWRNDQVIQIATNFLYSEKHPEHIQMKKNQHKNKL